MNNPHPNVPTAVAIPNTMAGAHGAANIPNSANANANNASGAMAMPGLQQQQQRVAQLLSERVDKNLETLFQLQSVLQTDMLSANGNDGGGGVAGAAMNADGNSNNNSQKEIVQLTNTLLQSILQDQKALFALSPNASDAANGNNSNNSNNSNSNSNNSNSNSNSNNSSAATLTAGMTGFASSNNNHGLNGNLGMNLNAAASPTTHGHGHLNHNNMNMSNNNINHHRLFDYDFAATATNRNTSSLQQQLQELQQQQQQIQQHQQQRIQQQLQQQLQQQPFAPSMDTHVILNNSNQLLMQLQHNRSAVSATAATATSTSNADTAANATLQAILNHYHTGSNSASSNNNSAINNNNSNNSNSNGAGNSNDTANISKSQSKPDKRRRKSFVRLTPPQEDQSCSSPVHEVDQSSPRKEDSPSPSCSISTSDMITLNGAGTDDNSNGNDHTLSSTKKNKEITLRRRGEILLAAPGQTSDVDVTKQTNDLSAFRPIPRKAMSMNDRLFLDNASSYDGTNTYSGTARSLIYPNNSSAAALRHGQATAAAPNRLGCGFNDPTTSAANLGNNDYSYADAPNMYGRNPGYLSSLWAEAAVTASGTAVSTASHTGSSSLLTPSQQLQFQQQQQQQQFGQYSGFDTASMISSRSGSALNNFQHLNLQPNQYPYQQQSQHVYQAAPTQQQQQQLHNYHYSHFGMSNTGGGGMNSTIAALGLVGGASPRGLASSPNTTNVPSIKKKKVRIIKKVTRTSVQQNRKIMYLGCDNDASRLSEFLTFLRSTSIEVFTATEDDVRERLASKRVTTGQVGIRCAFCAHLTSRSRAGRSSNFPSSISGIYQGVSMMIYQHFPNCEEMPLDVRAKYDELKLSTKRGDVESRSYWMEAAKVKGMMDSTEEGGDNEGSSMDVHTGIRFRSDVTSQPV
jgi:hypothetical protein